MADRGIAGPVARERDVVGLQRQLVAGHHRRKRGVHERLDLGHAAKARRQVQERGAPVLERAGRPRDRWRRRRGGTGRSTASDRRRGRAGRADGARLAPVGLAGIVGSEQQEDLGLQRIGVLELVDEDAREAALKPLRGPGWLSRTRLRATSSRSRKSSAPLLAFICS